MGHIINGKNLNAIPTIPKEWGFSVSQGLCSNHICQHFNFGKKKMFAIYSNPNNHSYSFNKNKMNIIEFFLFFSI